jgi:hypothetical protein
MRKVSLRVTRALIGMSVTANQLTVVMIAAGVLSGAALLIPGLPGALLSVVLMQGYLCSAGLARIRQLISGTGIHRLCNGIECTLFLLVAAVADAFTGGLTATHVAVLVVTIEVWILVPAHIASIVSSSRLR